MTRDQAKKLLPIIEAFANGETVQFGGGKTWSDVDDPTFTANPDHYRIKPKPRTFSVLIGESGIPLDVNLGPLAHQNWDTREGRTIVKCVEVLD